MQAIFERIVFNFMSKCNMSCPYCYVPFTDQGTDLIRMRNILDVIKSVGFKVITFSGGDPFYFKDFDKLLLYAAQLNFEVHIDTNAICLKYSNYDLLKETTSLLSLPLESSLRFNHDQIRKYPGHFDIVVNHLKRLESFLRIKINTVVTKLNNNDLLDLQLFLSNYNIAIWSLYQFIPLDQARMNKEKYFISDMDFDIATKFIKSDNYNIEVGPVKERCCNYIFVSQNGRVYTHNKNTFEEYITLGDIFNTEWVTKYSSLYDSTIRENIRKRYQQLTSQSSGRRFRN